MGPRASMVPTPLLRRDAGIGCAAAAARSSPVMPSCAASCSIQRNQRLSPIDFRPWDKSGQRHSAVTRISRDYKGNHRGCGISLSEDLGVLLLGLQNGCRRCPFSIIRGNIVVHGAAAGNAGIRAGAGGGGRRGSKSAKQQVRLPFQARRSRHHGDHARWADLPRRADDIMCSALAALDKAAVAAPRLKAQTVGALTGQLTKPAAGADEPTSTG